MFVLNASCIKPDNCNDDGDNERLDGALLHEADQRANDEEGRVGLDERGNGHLNICQLFRPFFFWKAKLMVL